MTGVGPRVCWELAGTAVAELPGKPHSRQADPQFPSLFVQLSRGTWSYTEALNISCHWKPRKLGVGIMGYDAGSFQGTETVCRPQGEQRRWVRVLGRAPPVPF